MKKSQSTSKSKAASVPATLLAQLEKQQALVAQQERRGHFGTYDHTKLARLETAVNEYKQDEVEK